MDYTLNPEQLTALSKRFPTIEFVSTGFAGHDHPVAHTSYQLVWQQVLNKLPANCKAADICGNPSHAERFNRPTSKAAPHIDVFCKVMCAKDAVRAKTRWGPKTGRNGTRWEEMSLYDMYRNEENINRFKGYDVFLMNHVIYYYTMGEIVKLLKMNPESVLYATLHKLPGMSGFVNCGEQEYVKDSMTGAVKMWNVETGESYKHPDPAIWFRNFEYADENGAIAWTINKGCDDSFILTITSCAPNLVSEDCWLDGRIVLTNTLGETATLAPAFPDVHTTPPPAYKQSEVLIDLGSSLGMNLPPKRIVITHPKLFETLCAYMINRRRDSRTLKDLTAKAQREAGNNALIGNNTRIAISSQALTEHIAAAFVGNVGLEDDLLSHVIPGARKLVGISNASIMKRGLYVALQLHSAFQSKDPAHKVLTFLDDVIQPGLL